MDTIFRLSAVITASDQVGQKTTMQGLIQGFSLLIGFDLLRYPFFDGLDPIFTAWFRMDSGGVWGGGFGLVWP